MNKPLHTLYKSWHNVTTFSKTFQHHITLYKLNTTLQTFIILYNIWHRLLRNKIMLYIFVDLTFATLLRNYTNCTNIPKCTKLNSIVHNCRKTYTIDTIFCKFQYKCKQLLCFCKNYTQLTKLNKTLQNSTQLYTRLHNFTQLFNTLQKFPKTVQNF